MAFLQEERFCLHFELKLLGEHCNSVLYSSLLMLQARARQILTEKYQCIQAEHPEFSAATADLLGQLVRICAITPSFIAHRNLTPARDLYPVPC